MVESEVKQIPCARHYIQYNRNSLHKLNIPIFRVQFNFETITTGDTPLSELVKNVIMRVVPGNHFEILFSEFLENL